MKTSPKKPDDRFRVFRGGGWFNYVPSGVRAASRGSRLGRACAPLRLHRVSVRAAGSGAPKRTAMRYVILGGSWGDSPAVVLRISINSKYPPDTAYACFGFRTRLGVRFPR